MPARVNPNAGRKSDAHRQRIAYRQKLMDVSDAGLQRIYEKALEQGRRDVANWCAMEAGRRKSKREREVYTASAAMHWLMAEHEIELNAMYNNFKREQRNDISHRARGPDGSLLQCHERQSRVDEHAGRAVRPGAAPQSG